MPPPKLVELWYAPYELARYWDIPNWIAEQIVRGVLQGRECFARGNGRGDMGLRDISKEIGATLTSSGPLFSWEFSGVEIDWEGLFKHGRKLVPREWEYGVSAAEARKTLTREGAIAELLQGGDRPPHTISWTAFCDLVRDRADGWKSKRHGEYKRGFSNRVIERLVRQQTAKPDRN
jgi:hypothetical protein